MLKAKWINRRDGRLWMKKSIKFDIDLDILIAVLYDNFNLEERVTKKMVESRIESIIYESGMNYFWYKEFKEKDNLKAAIEKAAKMFPDFVPEGFDPEAKLEILYYYSS